MEKNIKKVDTEINLLFEKYYFFILNVKKKREKKEDKEKKVETGKLKQKKLEKIYFKKTYL